MKLFPFQHHPGPALGHVVRSDISQYSLITGFVLGYLVLGMMATRTTEKSYFMKVRQTLAFALIFLKELTVSTYRVVYDILTPTHYMTPRCYRLSA